MNNQAFLKDSTNVMNVSIVFIFLAFITKYKHGLLTEMRKCKVSYSGGEYMGDISETMSGVPCLQWSSCNNKISSEFVDSDFPDGSKKLARNYCRNPKNKMGKPWCFRPPNIGIDPIKEFCDIPLCQYKRCKVSGPGVEYMGSKNKTMSDVICLSWTDYRNPWIDVKFPTGERIYPDINEILAGVSCRNPNGDPGGPWCFVEIVHNSSVDIANRNVIRQYCGIHFCDSPGGTLVVSNIKEQHKYFTQFNRLQKGKNSLEFSVKLWYPDKWAEAILRIAISIFPVPASGQQLRKWGTGFEIVIKNDEICIVTGSYEEPTQESHPPLLMTGNKWLNLVLNWDCNHTHINIKGKNDFLFIHEFKEDIFDDLNNTFAYTNIENFYYSIIATPTVWSFPVSIEDNFCEEIITTGFNSSRKMLMRKSPAGHELSFYVRASNDAIIKMTTAGVVDYPSIEVSFTAATNELCVELQLTNFYDKIVLFQNNTEFTISYWVWNNYNFIAEGEFLHIKYVGDEETVTIVSLTHELFQSLRWFSVGTSNTVAHWTFFCSPLESYHIPEAVPPNCIGIFNEVYGGTDWTSGSGLPCVPWNAVPDYFTLTNFSKIESMNYCRHLSKDDKKTYCHAIDVLADYTIKQELCEPRKCRLETCRKSGTGVDFIGELATTISQKTCQKWVSDTPNVVPPAYRNDILYPGKSIVNASNYCRNPSKDFIGPWCFTNGTPASVDLCLVEDCDRPLQCTIIIKGNAKFEHRFIILPIERKLGINFWLKNWDPSNYNGIIIAMKSRIVNDYFCFSVGGANESNRLTLVHFDESGKTTVLKNRNVPNIIRSGYWKEFQIVISTESISLFEGTNIKKPFFEWSQSISDIKDKVYLNKQWSFDFISFASAKDNYFGVHFNCTGPQMEISNQRNITVFHPASLWIKHFKTNELTIYVTTYGNEINANIHLFTYYETKTTGNNVNMKIYLEQPSNDNNSYIYFERGNCKTNRTKIPGRLINNLKWTKFVIKWLNYSSFHMEINENKSLYYNAPEAKESLFLYYYFTITVNSGELIWASNFNPPEIESLMRRTVDGQWSEWAKWQCSATCGGGHGTRFRTCENPKPSVFGRYCTGPEMNKGSCNVFPCGNLSPETLLMIENNLRYHSYNVEVLVGRSFKVDCSESTLIVIKKESPNSLLFWQKNGRLIKPEVKLKDVTPEAEVIRVKSAALKDCGLYVCVVQSRFDQRKSVIKITAVIVKDNKYTKHSRATQFITLKCGGLVLDYIYSNLDLSVMHNHKIWKHYYATPLSVINNLKIGPLHVNDSGIWECIIHQRDLKLYWKTEWIFLEVKRIPSVITHLMEDTRLRIIFKYFPSETAFLCVLIFLFAGIMISTTMVTYFIIMKARFIHKTKLKVKYKKLTPKKKKTRKSKTNIRD